MAEPVTGYLRDLTGAPIGAKQPAVVFTAWQASAGSSSLFVTDPIRVTLDPSTGQWSTELIASASTIPETVYDVAVEWLDPNFYSTGSGLTRKDVIQGLRVPVGGGDILDLLQAGSGPGWFWIETNDSIDPPGSKTGDLVLNPNTGIVTTVI